MQDSASEMIVEQIVFKCTNAFVTVQVRTKMEWFNDFTVVESDPSHRQELNEISESECWILEYTK